MEDIQHADGASSKAHGLHAPGDIPGVPVDSTKVLISKAYFDLVKKGTSKSISVKDVVEHAGVSRMTFYYHFKDIYDLVDWSLRTTIKQTLKDVQSVHDIWRVLADDMVELLENDTYGYLQCFQYLDEGILRRNFSELFYDLAYTSLQRDERLNIYDEDDKRFFARLITYCLSGILGDLLDHSTNVDVEDYIKRFGKLVVENLFPDPHASSQSERASRFSRNHHLTTFDW